MAAGHPLPLAFLRPRRPSCRQLAIHALCIHFGGERLGVPLLGIVVVLGVSVPVVPLPVPAIPVDWLLQMLVALVSEWVDGVLVVLVAALTDAFFNWPHCEHMMHTASTIKCFTLDNNLIRKLDLTLVR